MARVIKSLAILSFLLSVLFAGVYFLLCPGILPLAITCGTVCYHFSMRLLVGAVIDRRMGNRADYRRKWYRLRPFEAKLYRFLQVKKWKGRMPSYDPSLFDPRLHSWDRIAQAMCQAEIVHEVIAVLSFLPLLAAIPFGALGVFILTSLLAAGFDLCFVIMQRFNRARVLKLINKERAAK